MSWNETLNFSGTETKRSTVIGAQALLLSDLFYQGKFNVPWHQRYYDWKVQDVQALLQDIDEAVEEQRDCYFLGSIMLVSTEDRSSWEINDGQQRMVTVSLICASLCRRFASNVSVPDTRREALALRILFELDASHTHTLMDADRCTPRISPPSNDTMRYKQMIRGNSIGSNGLLTSAWNTIENYISPMNSEKLEKYFDFMLQKLEVACLRVPPHIDSNAVYETINCRGKPLDQLDQIRNFIYSYFSTENERQRRITVHDNLERVRTFFPNNIKAAEYMRCHLQCNFGFLHKDQLYRDVRKAVRIPPHRMPKEEFTVKNSVFKLIEKITTPEYLELFRIITSTNTESDLVRKFTIDSGTTNSPRNLEIFLQELRAYKVSQPLVFANLIQYIRVTDGRKRKRIARIVNKNIKRLSSFILRTAFVAPKFEPSHFETEFSNYAQRIATATDISDSEFADFLRECDRASFGILDNSKFRSIIEETRMSRGPRVKLFLLGINGELQPDRRLVNEKNCSVEHILPHSIEHSSTWSAFESLNLADWTSRIGNLTLLGVADNKPGSKFNGDFSQKKDIYERSGFALTRQLCEFNEWNPNQICIRQKKLAKIAVRVWAFD